MDSNEASPNSYLNKKIKSEPEEIKPRGSLNTTLKDARIFDEVSTLTNNYKFPINQHNSNLGLDGLERAVP